MLVITRGLPASGKSTWAREYVAQDPANRAAVSRDMFRRMLHAPDAEEPTPQSLLEDEITQAQAATVLTLLRAGKTVVVDNTNIRIRDVRAFELLAFRAGVSLFVQDFTHVSLEECLRRNAARAVSSRVPDQVLHAMAKSLRESKPLPRGYVEAPILRKVTPRADLPAAVLVDMDGTLALMGDRSPIQFMKVDSDLPNPPVVDTVKALSAAGMKIIIMSGRDEECRELTAAWLNKHVGVPVEAMFMRAHKDRHPDAHVKLELFNKHVRDRYDVRFVLDDRDQVVDLWRSLGLTCMQVATGDF